MPPQIGKDKEAKADLPTCLAPVIRATGRLLTEFSISVISFVFNVPLKHELSKNWSSSPNLHKDRCPEVKIRDLKHRHAYFDNGGGRSYH